MFLAFNLIMCSFEKDEFIGIFSFGSILRSDFFSILESVYTRLSKLIDQFRSPLFQNLFLNTVCYKEKNNEFSQTSSLC